MVSQTRDTGWAIRGSAIGSAIIVAGAGVLAVHHVSALAVFLAAIAIIAALHARRGLRADPGRRGAGISGAAFFAALGVLAYVAFPYVLSAVLFLSSR